MNWRIIGVGLAGVLVPVLLSFFTLGCGGSTPDHEPPGLCPVADASEDLLLCASFSALSEEGIQPEVGSRPLVLYGGASLIDGPFGSALALDGVDDRASLPGFELPGPALTIEAWVLALGEQDDFASLVDFWQDFEGFWMGGSQPAGGWAFWTGSDELDDIDAAVEGEWQHLAGVYDGDRGVAMMYINGILVRQLNDVLPMEQPVLDALGIGARGDRSAFFSGQIDELMIWATVRTAEQICEDAGGSYSLGGCDYANPVGRVSDPCAGVTCSGAGNCVLEGDRPTCQCDSGYATEGLTCVGDESPCDTIAVEANDWDLWYSGQLEADMLAAAEAAAADYVPVSSDWAPGAEAWTSIGQTALMSNALEPFCLGFLRAAAIDPGNPVALNNAASCMFVLDWNEDARRFLECSLHLAPQNASAWAGLGYYEASVAGDLAAALDHYQTATTLDPGNPEWPFQVMRIALDQGDRETADAYLDRLPAADPSGSAGWRGASSDGGAGGGGGDYCCPCSGSSYGNLLECTNNCSASLGCFAGICAYTATCEGGTSALAFGVKICYPPSGVQVCMTFDTNGNVGILLGASVFNGLLGVGAGFSYGTIDGAVNFVVDVGTSNLPINAGSTWTVNLATGQVQGAVGLGSQSGASAAQATIVDW